MGFRGKVSRSTLADANEAHDWRVYADLAQVLIHIARPMYANESLGFDCNGPRSLPPKEPNFAFGIVALVSPFSIISKRSSASRVRFAAPAGAPLTPPGRFGASSSKGKIARFGLGANVTTAAAKIAVRYIMPCHGTCWGEMPRRRPTPW